MEKNEVIENLLSIAKDVGKMMTEVNLEKLKVDEKSSFKDIVTNKDKEIQAFCIDKITKLIPDAKFFAEESNSFDDLASKNLFVIDPIDGTTNFVHNFSLSALSIAWYQSGKPVFGLVYNPFLKELYSAETNKGATLNGKPIKVSGSPLQNSVAMFGTSPYSPEFRQDTLKRLNHIYTRCQDVRRFGSAALDICYVAAGRAGLYFESSISFWDYAAAEIILKEAGGLLLNFNGEELGATTKKTSAIAGNRKNINDSGMVNFQG